jgi:hypothetical protein
VKVRITFILDDADRYGLASSLRIPDRKATYDEARKFIHAQVMTVLDSIREDDRGRLDPDDLPFE